MPHPGPFACVASLRSAKGRAVSLHVGHVPDHLYGPLTPDIRSLPTPPAQILLFIGFVLLIASMGGRATA